MRFLKNVLSQLHTLILWLLLSAILWAWIFTLVTDTTPDKKVTVYCQVPAVTETELAVRLEEDMPQGLKMIKVHPFSYLLFNPDVVNYGDVFIIPASEIEAYRDDLAPVDGQFGVKVYDAATGDGILTEYIQYTNEDYYLFLGANSVHLDDGKALAIAQSLLALG